MPNWLSRKDSGTHFQPKPKKPHIGIKGSVESNGVIKHQFKKRNDHKGSVDWRQIGNHEVIDKGNHYETDDGRLITWGSYSQFEAQRFLNRKTKVGSFPTKIRVERVYIKYPNEEPELYLKRQEIFREKFPFQGHLRDGRPVQQIGNKWVYIV